MPDGFIQLDKTAFESGGAYGDLNRMLQLLFDQMPGDGETVRIYKGYGSPEGAVVAGVGSLYLRLDGGTDTTLYRKESGTGATGWVAIINPTYPLSLANGGTGVALEDPNGDRLFFWDDSEGVSAFLTVGSGLTISGTTITANMLSNVLFQFQALTDSATLTTATTYTSALGSNYQYIGTTSSSYTTMYRTKMTKLSGVNTVTVYAQIWQENSSTDLGFDNRVFCQVDINAGGVTGSVTGVRGVVTPTWHTLSALDISGLSNGTVYDVLVQIKRDASNARAYIGNVIGFGS